MTAKSDIATIVERLIPGTADAITLNDAINIALQRIGDITKTDETLTVVNNQTEYSLPSGVKNVTRVKVAASTSAPYDYVNIFDWREVEGYLCFPDELDYDAGNQIRILYNGQHDAVSDESDTIDDSIPIQLLTAIAHYEYMFLRYQDKSNISIKEKEILNKIESHMFEAMQRYKVIRMKKSPTLNTDTG